MPSDRDELLQRVYRRANAMWWRRRPLPLGAAALVLIAAVAVVLPRALDGGRPSQHLHVASEGSADTTTLPEIAVGPAVAGETPTSSASLPVPTTRPDDRVIGSPIQTTTSRPGGPTPTTPSGDHCRNNNGDPSCGDFRWASDPGSNAPLQFDVQFSPANPKAGQTVTFTVHVVDPDASPINNCGDLYQGPSSATTRYGGGAGGCAHTMECAANYGAWDVPGKQRGEATFTFQHAFASAGTYEGDFYAESMQGSKTNSNCASPPNPYASEGWKSVTVEVSS